MKIIPPHNCALLAIRKSVYECTGVGTSSQIEPKSFISSILEFVAFYFLVLDIIITNLIEQGRLFECSQGIFSVVHEPSAKLVALRLFGVEIDRFLNVQVNLRVVADGEITRH